VHHDFVLCLYARKYVQPDLIAHPSGILLLARRSTILVVDRGIILPESCAGTDPKENAWSIWTGSAAPFTVKESRTRVRVRVSKTRPEKQARQRIRTKRQFGASSDHHLPPASNVSSFVLRFSTGIGWNHVHMDGWMDGWMDGGCPPILPSLAYTPPPSPIVFFLLRPRSTSATLPTGVLF
jgi:hypothetical protein